MPAMDDMLDDEKEEISCLHAAVTTGHDELFSSMTVKPPAVRLEHTVNEVEWLPQ